MNMGEEGAPSRATVGNVAMAARSGTCSPMPWPMPPQPQAREEGTTTPLALSYTVEQAEALACNCSLSGESRTPIAFAHPPQASAAASDAEPLVRPRAEESRPPQLQAREEETPAPLAPSSAGEHSEARACSLGEERLVYCFRPRMLLRPPQPQHLLRGRGRRRPALVRKCNM